MSEGLDPEAGAALAELAAMFGPRLLTGASARAQYSRDESSEPPASPQAVLLPATVEEVASAVRICRDHRFPVVPYGVGSGQEGGVHAVRGGLTIATRELQRVIEVNLEDHDCLVEAGVTRSALAAALHGTGLYFPVDPGADASFGGMAATGAAGTTSPRYGTMHDNVIGLEVVMPDGDVIQTGSRARKDSSGYDLTSLFVGSEGTLGIITKLRLRLHPLPEARLAVRASFGCVADAARAVSQMMSCAVALARAELLDGSILRGLRLAGATELPPAPMLFLEIHGSQDHLGALACRVEEMLLEHGATDIARARQTEDIERLWRLRHAASSAEKQLRPGSVVSVTDIAVPVSAIPAALSGAEDLLATLGLVAAVTGHIADGNLHHAILLDPDDATEHARAGEFRRRLAELALSLGGVISGEHGIGLGKMDLMGLAHGCSLDWMRRVKAAFDPCGIMNPGKVLP